MPTCSKINMLLALLIFTASCNAGGSSEELAHTKAQVKKQSGYASDELFKITVPPRIDQTDALELIRRDEAAKSPLTFARGDFEGSVGGKMKVEYAFYNDATYLNSKIPDQFGLFKQNIDIIFDLIYGQKKYGHKACEMLLDLRSKNKWGVIGSYKNTSEAEVSLDGISLGSHDHKNSRPSPWFKDAWMKFSFNSIFNSKSENLHFFKIGWFPFKLGRGIALGEFYATAYEHLGLFSYTADASAPGIYVKGKLIKNKLSYGLYYSKFEDKSTSISETYNDAKKNHVGRWANPWMGEAQDDELWAARLKIKPFDNHKAGKLKIEPYVFYNAASAQKVEVKNDTRTQLGAYGLATEYYNGNFEIGGEVAFNFGNEKLFAIDRNKIGMTINDNGQLTKTYDKVRAGNPTGTNVVVYSDSQTAVRKYTGSENGEYLGTLPANTAGPYTEATNIYNYKQDSTTTINNRYRPSYKNTFKGWMATVDASYKIPKWNLLFAAEYAYASGDGNPHAVEENKNYNGFVGLHELYAGKRVYSSFVLGERQIKQPLSLRIGETGKIGSHTSFTDVQLTGAGLTWTPKKLKLNPNVIFFWKTHTSLKANPETGSYIPDEKASNFKGTELNLISSYKLLDDLSIDGVFALFFPGSYYKDIKGVKMSGDYYDTYINGKIPDSVTVTPADYRIADGTAAFMNISLTYKF